MASPHKLLKKRRKIVSSGIGSAVLSDFVQTPTHCTVHSSYSTSERVSVETAAIDAPEVEENPSKPDAFRKLEAFAFEPPPRAKIPSSKPVAKQLADSPVDVLRRSPHTEASECDLKTGQIIPGACEALVTIAHELVAALDGRKFALPVTCVYNPLVYAGNLHEQYIRKHGGRRVEVLLVGMNPGPFGMAQTGVPFGDSSMVRDFHGIMGKVESPMFPHPKRPVYGMQCPRLEISGQRLWGWARDRFGCAASFFARFWVYNYCPLVFMEASGKNRTPDKLHPPERKSLELICNEALVKTISIVQPKYIVGIGKYATDRIQNCGITGGKIGNIMHPSPANPQANKGWSNIIEAQLSELGVIFEK